MKRQLAILAFAILLSTTSQALATITLNDGSATFTMRDGTFTFGNWAGDLFTDAGGQDHLFRNQWYYRSELNSFEHELGSDNNTDEGATGNTGFIEWSEGGFDFRLDLVLLDTGEGLSEVDQLLSVTNTTAGPLAMTLYNYSDFEFGGFNATNSATRDADGFTVTNPTILDKTARHYDYGQADHWALADAFDILDLFNDFNADDLNDTNTIAFNDMTGAFQFDLLIGAGETATVHTGLAIVPEPGALLLLGVGLGCLFVRNRRNRRK